MIFENDKTESLHPDLQKVDAGTLLPPPTPRTASSTHLTAFVPNLRLPAALLVGACITAGTTFALVKHVQHLIANAAVNADPETWLQKARTDGYEACYNGCNDCHDINWSYNACQLTVQAQAEGVNCSGLLMWNWVDRYPTVCLQALGVIYKAQALKDLKQSYRNQLSIIILTVLAGVLGAWIVYRKIWPRFLPIKSPASWPAPPSYYQSTAARPRSKPKSKRRHRQWPAFWRTAASASMIPTARAYACWGYSPKSNQYFTNPTTNISGVIHGWTSDCYTQTEQCGQSCSGGDPTTGAGQTCTTTYCTYVYENASPSYYVNYAAGRVSACGFQLVDNVPQEVSLLRVGNPLLERNWRVRVSVSQYNISDATDPSVWCLYDFGND
jgi:hypothetical protein